MGGRRRDESEVVLLHACKTGVTEMVQELRRARVPVDTTDVRPQDTFAAAAFASLSPLLSLSPDRPAGR